MSKVLSTTISITRLLAETNCTYNEADTIIDLLQEWIKQSRENAEYDTVADCVKDNKTKCVDNEVVRPLNYVETFC